MLSNAYFLAKFRFDTAENDPAKNCNVLLILKIRLALEREAARGVEGMLQAAASSAFQRVVSVTESVTANSAGLAHQALRTRMKNNE